MITGRPCKSTPREIISREKTGVEVFGLRGMNGRKRGEEGKRRGRFF